MKKNLFALGVSLLFLGVIFIAFSNVVVQLEPLKKWTAIDEVDGEQETLVKLSAQGDLTEGDRFRVYFSLYPPTGSWYSVDQGVYINFTDPNGHTETYDVAVTSEGGYHALMTPFPEGVANYTGTYRADALGLFVSLRYLALQRMDITEREPQYPHSNFFFVGCAVFSGGIGTLYLGSKALRHRRVSLKRRLSRNRH